MKLSRICHLLLLAAAAAALGACVEVPTRPDSVVSTEFGGAGEGRLAVDPETGLVLVSITEILSPVAFKVNRNPPRRFQLIGVQAPDKNDFPEAYSDAIHWVHEYVARRQNVSLKLTGQDTSKDPLIGTIYLPVEDNPRHNIDVIQNMLSQGLLVLKEDGELSDRTTLRLYREAQRRAILAKRGVWKTVPVKIETGHEE